MRADGGVATIAASHPKADETSHAEADESSGGGGGLVDLPRKQHSRCRHLLPRQGGEEEDEGLQVGPSAVWGALPRLFDVLSGDLRCMRVMSSLHVDQ